jgi:mono/diheme cytochrome c family protein
VKKIIWNKFCENIDSIRVGLLGSVRLKPSFYWTVLPLLIALAVFRVESLAYALQGPPTSSVWDGAYTEAQAKRGELLFGRECAKCHGATLSGGGDAPALSGGTFLSNWGGLTVGDLFERIRTTMPQDDPEKLSSQQYADILAFILSRNDFPAGISEIGTHAEMLKLIQIDANKPASSNAPSGTSNEPVANVKPKSDSTSGNRADNGKQLFASAGCAGCHGPSAKGAAGPPLAPPSLPLPEFLKFVRKPPGTMIPFSKDQVSDDQLADIYSFLQSLAQPSTKVSQ